MSKLIANDATTLIEEIKESEILHNVQGLGVVLQNGEFQYAHIGDGDNAFIVDPNIEGPSFLEMRELTPEDFPLTVLTKKKNEV